MKTFKANSQLTKATIKKIDMILEDDKTNFHELTQLGYLSNDICVGDHILWVEAQFTGSFRNAKFAGHKAFNGIVESESYSAKGQHTFTIKNVGRRKGRTIHKVRCVVLKEAENKQSVLDEKHARGTQSKKQALEVWLANNLPSHPRYAEKQARFDACA